MAFTNAALNAATNGLLAAYPFLSLHSADPGSTGASETSAARTNPGWPAASGSGDSTVSNVAFTGVAANGAVTFFGLWSAATGGTFGGGFALTGDQTANSAGAYTVTLATVNATAT